MTRATHLDAAVRAVAERMSLTVFEPREFYRNWLDDPEYLLPIRSIRAEFRERANAALA